MYPTSLQRCRKSLLLGATLLMALVFACSNLTGPPPERGLTTEELNFVRIGPAAARAVPVPLARLVAGKDPAVRQPVTAASGGSVQFVHSTDAISLTFSLDVPAGALPADAEITLALASQQYLMIDLGPEGTVFNVPVTLKLRAETLDLSDRDGASIKIYWYNPDTCLWEEQKATVVADPDSGVLESVIELDHFSIYAWA